MSNILIIKHGSLGDLIQANGAIKDIKNFIKIEKFSYLHHSHTQFLCQNVLILDGVIIDKRLPRWNIFYLKVLKKSYQNIILQRFLIYKILVEQNFIKDLFLKMLNGLHLKLLWNQVKKK